MLKPFTEMTQRMCYW